MSYKCVASNKYGTSKTIGVLVVKCKNPPIRKSPSPSPSPSRSLSQSPTTVNLINNSALNRNLSPMRNIDLPPPILQAVIEEPEIISSSQSESENLKVNLLEKNLGQSSSKQEEVSLICKKRLI